MSKCALYYETAQLEQLSVQELLDLEAQLGNQRYAVNKMIKSKRGPAVPSCWGQDDCSTLALVHCPWRIDCEEGRDGT